jgi:hypothetical protein
MVDTLLYSRHGEKVSKELKKKLKGLPSSRLYSVMNYLASFDGCGSIEKLHFLSSEIIDGLRTSLASFFNREEIRVEDTFESLAITAVKNDDLTVPPVLFTLEYVLKVQCLS